MKTFYAIIGFFGVAGTSLATPPCHVQQIQAVQAIQYATPVLPLYTIGYQSAVDLSPLIEEIRALRGEVQQLRSGGGVLPLREEPLGLKTLRVACAKCHTEGTAKGKFAIFDAAGTILPDPTTTGKIVAAIHEGKMPPPPGKLSAEERYNILYHLAVQPVTAAKGK